MSAAAYGMQRSIHVMIYNFSSCSPYERTGNTDSLRFSILLFFPPLSRIPFSCFIVGSFPHVDFSLLPPCSLSSRLLICLSICLGRVWPCPSLPLQEVVSRLIESRLRSLEANTCSEELLFNCTSHTLVLTGLPVRTHEPNTHTHTVFDLTRSHSLVLALSHSFCSSTEEGR